MKKYPWKRGVFASPWAGPPTSDCQCDNCRWSNWVWNVLSHRLCKKELLDYRMQLRKTSLAP